MNGAIILVDDQSYFVQNLNFTYHFFTNLLIMDLYKFEDEQAVQKEADRLISKIFADKSYSNP